MLTKPMGREKQRDTVPEGIEFLLGSKKRLQTLAALEDGERRQATIARECEVGRSTAHRIITALEQRNWVTEGEDGYVLTPIGDRVLSAYYSFADTVECVSEYEPLIRCLEGIDIPVPSGALAGADLVTPSEHNPHAPLVAAAEMLRGTDAERVRTAWSGVSPIKNDAGEDHLAEGNEVEVVVDRGTLKTSRELYFENYQLALASDRVDLYVTDDPFDVGVLLAGDRAAVTGSRDGHVVICIHGDTEELGQWSMKLYDRLRSRATRIEVEYPMPGTVERTDTRSRSGSSSGGRVSNVD